MSLEARLARLERAIPRDDGFCSCAGPTRFRLAWSFDDVPDPEPCPKCGRPVRRIALHWPGEPELRRPDLDDQPLTGPVTLPVLCGLPDPAS